jgi:hypothetical protein
MDMSIVDLPATPTALSICYNTMANKGYTLVWHSLIAWDSATDTSCLLLPILAAETPVKLALVSLSVVGVVPFA